MILETQLVDRTGWLAKFLDPSILDGDTDSPTDSESGCCNNRIYLKRHILLKQEF